MLVQGENVKSLTEVHSVDPNFSFSTVESGKTKNGINKKGILVPRGRIGEGGILKVYQGGWGLSAI